MNTRAIVQKALASTISAALLLLPASSSWAAGVSARVAPVEAVPGFAGAGAPLMAFPESLAGQNLALGQMMDIGPAQGPSFGPMAAASPVFSPDAAPQAAGLAAYAAPSAASPFQVPAGQHAVSQAPVLGIIEDLQRRGVVLSGDSDAAQQKAAINALPAGAVKDNLLSFMGALGGGAGSIAGGLGRAYDGGGVTGDSESPAPGAPAEGPIKERLRLAPELLRYTPNLETFPNGTADAPRAHADEILGQEPSTLDNLRRGLARTDKHSNVLVTGPDAAGRGHAVMQTLLGIAPSRPTPDDLVQVPNFKNPDQPVTLELEPGKGPEFVAGVNEALESMGMVIAQQLHSDQLEQGRATILGAIQKQFDDDKAPLDKELSEVRFGKDDGFGLQADVQVKQKGPTSFAVAAMLMLKYKGKPVPVKPVALRRFLKDNGLSASDLDEAKAKYTELAQAWSPRYMEKAQNHVRALMGAQGEIRQLEGRIAGAVISQLMEPLGMIAARAKVHDDEGHKQWRARAK
ncbi:MAG TPA: Lon-like protease helical domain-containing protein, partial [Elusimicrobiota bacterium]|nr:Lon-like protease helical domain-containing protein [Elusimicrobiota bacterium]